VKGISALRTLLAPGLLALAFTSICTAQSPKIAAMGKAYWRQAAVSDVEAAFRMLRDDHPGAAPQLGDDAFRRTLASAHELAMVRAKTVSSFAGYSAALAGFANAFGDKHLRSRPTLEVSRPDWAGIILVKRGTHWMVFDTEDGAPEAALIGAELVSCDGRTPEDWGRELMGGFRADWSSDAQKIQTAPWLLLSESNPFVGRPQSCTFSGKGEQRSWTLQWRAIKRADLDVRLQKASPFGAAGFGVRQVGAGYWIALQSLLNSAVPVVEAVKARAEDLRKAPFIVLDMRGNGGGSSIFGNQIAEQILGEPYVSAIIGDDSTCGGDTFRATPGNIRTFQGYIDTGFPTHDPQVVGFLKKAVADMRAAQAAGRSFTGPLSCPTRRVPLPNPEFSGKLYVLTDGLCFSSCLAVVDEWLKFGAVQLGQSTDSNTYFTDVRDTPLPSGLSTFSTMMAINVGGEPRLGPFVPTRSYDGDISDTPRVEAWAASIASEAEPSAR